jgi:endonuclease YncB( thermonuclease family)
VDLKVWLALIVLWAAAVPAFAQTDSDTKGTGTSHGFAVSDGDTVKFGRQRIRLFGIDAPEKAQPCDDGHWYPGPLATKALIAFIGGRPVSCHEVDFDHKNNRPVAVCFAGKDDLQALMVSAGWAWAYTAFSDSTSMPRDGRQRAASAFTRIAVSHRGSGGPNSVPRKKRVNRLRCADRSDKINERAGTASVAACKTDGDDLQPRISDLLRIFIALSANDIKSRSR